MHEGVCMKNNQAWLEKRLFTLKLFQIRYLLGLTLQDNQLRSIMSTVGNKKDSFEGIYFDSLHQWTDKIPKPKKTEKYFENLIKKGEKMLNFCLVFSVWQYVEFSVFSCLRVLLSLLVKCNHKDQMSNSLRRSCNQSITSQNLAQFSE